MHTWLGALVSILLVAGSTAGADEKKEHSTPQAQRMTECNAQARDRHLSRPADGEHGGQGEKMKACNQEAAGKNLHGDERKQFMSHCLKAEKNP